MIVWHTHFNPEYFKYLATIVDFINSEYTHIIEIWYIVFE